MNREEEAKKHLRILIESAVDEVITEDVLTQAFIEPFTDIFKTAKHGLETSIASIAGNAKKVAKQVGAAALPFVASGEIKRIGQEEEAKIKQAIAGLDSEYADVLQRNWDTLRTRDVAGLALLLNPTLTIGGHAALQAPALGLGVLEILTGGHPAVKELRRKASELSKKVLPPEGSAGDAGGGAGGLYADDYGWGGDFGGFGESIKKESDSILTEQQKFTKQQLDQKVGQVMKKLLQRKDVQRAIQNSPITQALKNSGINAVTDRARKIASFSSLEQFEQYMGADFKKFHDQIETKIPADTPPEAIKEFEQQQVVELKKAYQQFYTKYLRDIAGKTPGVADAVRAAMQVVSQLG